MSRKIDKNDVDITKLYRWFTEIQLDDPVTNQTVTVYMRLVGDADINRARAYAFRNSRELRRRLKDPESDDRIAYLNELSEFDSKDILISTILILLGNDFQKYAMKTIDVPIPREPKSDEKLETWEDYQTKVDEYTDIYRKALTKEMKKLRRKEKKHLETKTIDILYTEYETLIAEHLCSEEMNTSYYNWCISCSLYKDKEHKKPLFKNISELLDLAPQVIETLTTSYHNLELGMSDLKK